MASFANLVYLAFGSISIKTAKSFLSVTANCNALVTSETKLGSLILGNNTKAKEKTVF